MSPLEVSNLYQPYSKVNKSAATCSWSKEASRSMFNQHEVSVTHWFQHRPRREIEVYRAAVHQQVFLKGSLRSSSRTDIDCGLSVRE